MVCSRRAKLSSPLLPSFVSRKVEGAEGVVITPGLRQRAREWCFFVFFYPPLETNVNRSQPALVQQPREGKHSPESAQYFLLLQSLWPFVSFLICLYHSFFVSILSFRLSLLILSFSLCLCMSFCLSISAFSFFLNLPLSLSLSPSPLFLCLCLFLFLRNPVSVFLWLL